MKIKSTLLLAFIFSTFFCFSQSRNDNWNFGNNASVSFPLGGAPVATINSAFTTEEGSSSISDANGNLLFYSDGGNVYDASNNLMPNGNNIQGYIYQGSSTQSCIIIKKPGSTTLFYIFTVAESSNNPNPFSYSIVDMSLNAGLGDVVIASKNTLIFNGTSEKIAATYHCNGTDIWIATHDINSSNYRVVLLSASGVGAPVLSAIGPIVTNIGGAAGDQGAGSMKFSHDGDKLAMCNLNNSDILDILDFNKTTGVFSNRLNIFNVADAGKLYGLEFSPNNQILYVTNGDNVLQYNISSGVAATIAASRLIVGLPFDNNVDQLQLAPNGKIYCAQTRTQPLGIINSPNTLGVGCNWDLAGFDVDPGLLGNEVRLGLPSLLHFIPTKFIYPGGSSTSATYCQGDPSTPIPSFVSSYPVTGLFSSTIGLSINATTGAINLAASTPNIYTVTFTATVTVGCVSPFFSTYTIIITPGVALCYTKQAAKWYMGNKIGLNFLCSSPPSILDDGTVNASQPEGGASISDINGNLLFYVFDSKIKNKNHTIMPNGNAINCDASSSQGAVTVPNLSNPNKYYVFTIKSGTAGLYYSEVDMTLNAGLGDVIIATKNTLLLSNVGEQITAVENCNGTGTWVIVHSATQMFAYLVTVGGIAAPVISTVPTIPQNVGQLSASPTGRHIAYSTYNGGTALYTFDNENGKICLKENLTFGGYGNSFSNNGKYLYVQELNTGIYQYDAYAATVNSTGVFIDMPFLFGTMQLGPDCKLYTFGLSQSMGSVINFPNLPGLACNFQPLSFPVSNLGNVTQYGVPNYIQSWFKDPTYVEPVIAANYTYVTACLPSPTTFTNTSTHITECPTYSWNFGDPTSGVNNTSSLTNPTHVFSSPGTYSVTLTLTERCQTSIKIIPITVYGAPIVTIIADTTVCENFGVTLNTSSTGTYLWTGPSGNMTGIFTSTLQNPTNPVFLGDGFANEGWYYLTVTNAGGCSATDSIYITILAVPSPNVTSSIVNCIQTLTATVGTSNGPITSYAWGPSGGSSLGTTSVITLPSGYPGPQVVLTVLDSESCGAGFILSTPPLVPPTVTAGAPLVLTCTTLSGNITASSTTPGATYSWAGAGVTAGGTTSSATVNIAGTYTVTVTNPSNGCTVSATVAVTASTTLPTAIIIADTTVCDHDLVTLSTPSIGTYLWTGPGFGGGFSSTLQNPTNPPHLGLNFFNEGWYYLTVTNSSGCSTTDSVYISILTPPDPYFLDSIANCQHIFTVGVFSSNGPIISYVWGPIVLGTDSVVTVPFGYSGAINCFLLDSEGCGQGIIWSTTPPVPPTATAGLPLVLTCTTLSGNITASSLTPGATFNWTGAGITAGAATSTATVNAANTYTVTVTDPANGCTATTTVAVTTNTTAPTVTSVSSNNIDCSNLTTTLTGTSLGNTMVWNGGSLPLNSPNPAIVSAAGTYTVTSTDATNGCTNTSTVVVTASGAIPNISISVPLQITCTTASVTLTGSSSTPGVVYQWTGGPASPTYSVGTANTYTLTITDLGTGCASQQTVVVTSNTTAPTATAGLPLLLTCTTLSGNITASSLTPGATFSWTGAGITAGAATSTATVNAANTYTVTVTNPANGCTATTTVSVTTNTTPPAATAGAPLILTCTALSGNITASSLTPGATFSWTGAGITAGAATSTATVNAANTFTVTVTNPANGCTSTTTVAVTSNTIAPTATAGLPLVLTCTTLSGNITASSLTPGATFNWTGAGITAGAATSTATVNAAGTYTVTVTNPLNGCTSTTTVTVTSNVTIPNATSGPSQNISCITGLASISANSTTAGATYAWTGAGISAGGSTSTPTVNLPGTYTVTVTDPTSGCTATSTVIVGINPGPTANSGLDVTITSGTSTTLTGTGGGTYLWNTGATTNSILVSPSVTTDYCVTVTDINGCSDSSCVRVNVDILCGDLFVPNAFSPNGDGFNDVFRIKINPDCVIDMQLLVFDRWGEKIIEITDPTQFWDGTFRGKQLDNGVFVYYLTLTLKNATDVIKQNGNVSLIK